MDSKTVDFYNKNAETYAAETVKSDMRQTYTRFLSYLPEDACILDAGCGSGRDTRYFADCGYEVVAVDASEEMCRIAEKFVRQRVLHLTFEEIRFDSRFDGIWACASLLHIRRKDLPGVLRKFRRALKPDGILYASWKLGENERTDGERFYCDMTFDKMESLLMEVPGLKAEEMWETHDVRAGYESFKWLNVILRRM